MKQLRLRQSRQRGSAMVVAMGATVMMLFLGVAVLGYAARVSSTNTQRSRETRRFDCASSGLSLARDFYGRNFGLWSSYLATAAAPTYNALATPNWGDVFKSSSSLRTSHPELFADLDGDGSPDVYFFVRDNEDETAPPQDWTHDADNTVYVGAVCISNTMSQKKPGISTTQDLEIAEALITPSIQGTCIHARASGNGTGNINC